MSQLGYFENVYPWNSITTETISIGTNNYQMVKIPKFYVKYVDSEDQPAWYVYQSAPASAPSGYEVHPAFKRGTNTMSCFYMGAYASTDGTAATSQSGNSVVNMSINTSRKACNALNTTLSAAISDSDKIKHGWHLVNIYEWMAVALLMTVEMGGPDMQTLLGAGTNVNYGASSNSTSTSNWRGLYSLYGHNWEWVDGLMVNKDSIGAGKVSVFNPADPVIPTNLSEAANATNTNGAYSGFNYTDTTAVIPTNGSGSFWTGFSVDTTTANQYTKYCFLPKAIAASEAASSTGDALWSNTSADRVCVMGGHSNNGTKCGMFYFSLIDDASNSNDNNGFRVAKYGDGLA